MGAPIRGARPPSQVAYYVALAGVVCLLLMLCCYFLYFCITRVKELAAQEYSSRPPQPQPRTAPASSAYPVQPVVRDSASAMAKLCRQLPTQPQGGTVFPTEDNAPQIPAAMPPTTKLPATPPITKLPATPPVTMLPAPVICVAPPTNEVVPVQ